MNVGFANTLLLTLEQEVLYERWDYLCLVVRILLIACAQGLSVSRSETGILMSDYIIIIKKFK